MVSNIAEDPDLYNVVHFELAQGFAQLGCQGLSLRVAKGCAMCMLATQMCTWCT